MSAVEGSLEAVLHVQDAVLPKGLPVPQGVELAARYLLAEDVEGAGGDWFDAIPLADGRVVLVVGDVVGHGIEAAAVMAALKALFEERAADDGDVVAALELLDARARRVHEARSATVCAGVLDPVAGDFTYCTAGHPPPVVASADGAASYLPATGAGPLASGRGFATGSRRLAAGDLVLLYSDGLVARRARTPGRNTVDLVRVVEDAVRGAPSGERVVERVCREAVELLAGGGHADDTAVLAARLVPTVAELSLELRAVPDTVRDVRSRLGDWLAGVGAGELDRTTVQHAVGELVSNAVLHAYPSADGDNPVHVTVGLAPDGWLEVRVADRGTWREPSGGRESRGLAMARGFLDELRVEHDGSGTCAHGRHRVTRPAALLRGSSRPASHRTPASTFDLAVDDDVLHVAGALDLRAVAELRHACGRASRGGNRPVTLDLTEVDLLSSAAVQALHDACAAGPVDLVAPMGSPAQHVLDLVGLPYRS